jgi:sulfofructose kinase
MSQPLVIGMGVPVADYLINLERLPKPNEGSNALCHSWQFGGKVATGMAALGRLGIPCAYMGIAGDDYNGWANQTDFQFNGVDTSHMVFDANYETAYCVVLSDRQTGGRSIIGSSRNVRRPEPRDLDEAFIKSARYLHIECATPADRLAAQWVHDAGGQVLCDADWYSDAVDDFIPHIDIFIPSEFYYNKCCGNRTPLAWCREMADRGPHTVIITLGERGCVGICPQGEFTLPAYKVDVQDTTGAGDVFHGAYFHGLVNGWAAPECARFASAVSAIKCTAIGGCAALPTVDIVLKFMETGELDRGYIDERLKRYSQPPHVQHQVFIQATR